MKRCYYDILQLDRKATSGEIKTSYRKLALKFHPDKNTAEDAKERFVQINEAYNVLSDPNQRTWYDNNREKILFNKEEMTEEDIEMYSFGFNIWNYFTPSCYKGFDDGQGGFYAVYRDIFEKIKTEENKAYNAREDLQEDARKYEGFGDSTTVEDKVLKFYEDWENFTTYKTFIWSEQWDTRDANNRWVRRQMQKQNKKQRQNEKKTYLKTVKDLAAYVKKRDPRFRQILVKLREQEQKKAQQKLEKQKQKKRQKQQQKIVKQRLEEQRFRQIQEYYKKQNEEINTASNKKGKADQQSQDDEQQFYCQICAKGFKSQNQFKNHEKSKQHKQNVKDLQKQVMLKQQILQKAEEQEHNQPAQNEKQEPVEQLKEDAQKKNKKKKKKKNHAQKQQSDQQPIEKEEPVKVEIKEKEVEPKEQIKKGKKVEKKQEPFKKEQKKEEKKEEKKEQKQKQKADSDSDDDDDFMNALLNNRKKKQTINAPVQTAAKKQEKKWKGKVLVDQDEQSEEQGERGLNKAKLKKQKKAQQQKIKPIGVKCNGCNESFPSKSKLFQHIKKTGHASAK